LKYLESRPDQRKQATQQICYIRHLSTLIENYISKIVCHVKVASFIKRSIVHNGD
jgi:hypothetical protein